MVCFLVAKWEPGYPPELGDLRATAIPRQDTRTLSVRTLTASVAIQARVMRVPQVRDSLVRLNRRQTSRTTTVGRARRARVQVKTAAALRLARVLDRKSTRLNSSHVKISYAVSCLNKK